MTRLKRIKVNLAFETLSNADLPTRLMAVHDAMNGNGDYPHPPVDLPVFRTKIDSFIAANVAALDSKIARIARDTVRHELITMVRMLGHYVEANCDNDPARFASSGFTALSYTRRPPKPLDPPNVALIDQGNTGQLLIKVEPNRDAYAYELKYAALGTAGIPGPWSTVTFTSTKVKVAVDALTPGIIYTFQARVLGRLGFSDWSNAVNRMCI
jgi:hypothetical protein